MKNISIIYNSIPEIGYVSRRSTNGKEQRMVNNYLDYLIGKYEKYKKKKAVVFIEPQIESGYPDIVIAEFNHVPTSSDVARDKLSVRDLKILAFIHSKRNIAINDLTAKLGFQIEEIRKSIASLAEAGFISLAKDGKRIERVFLSDNCTLTKLISIEAKVDKWREAIRQAETNVWFSTESYIMMNKDKCTAEIKEMCENEGIGIILVNGSIQHELKATRRKYPVSYASLQFNEWIYSYYHHLQNKGEIF